jgi:hypothetical protein
MGKPKHDLDAAVRRGLAQAASATTETATTRAAVPARSQPPMEAAELEPR